MESIKDRGSGSRSKLCFSTQLTALGRTVLREPDYEQRNASDRAESIAEVDYALTSPMRRILLAFVEVATQSDTMTVPYHSIVSVEESGAIDYYITNSAEAILSKAWLDWESLAE